MKLLNRENHIPVLPPYNITMFDRELLEIARLNVAIILRMRVRKKERRKINCPGRPVAEINTQTHFSDVFSLNDI